MEAIDVCCNPLPNIAGEKVTFGYERTRLWCGSLGEIAADQDQDPRTRLRAAYHSFRQRAALLAAEIPQDLREYTVHDASHLDALWEIADLIAGPDISLTPTEGFVLGGAFLVHDLGMGLGAWPGGMTELTSSPGWNDVVAATFFAMNGTAPSEDELNSPSAEVLTAAKETALRENHAHRAADLALISWTATGTNDHYFLIDDIDLRITYGQLIGKLASSHWWDLGEVSSSFSASPIGAPVDCPDDWTVNPLKMACLMRLADAAHLDARRAPGFLRAIRRVGPHSDQHWLFQQRMQRARQDADRLVFSAARPFGVSEAEAWWLCYDTVQMVDRELRSVDALLADRSLTRMRLRGVKGADSPVRFSESVPTEGWIPVDARITVGNVPSLVRKLGGEMLYGKDSGVAVRELIQNASDASIALTSLASGANQNIVVSIYEEDGSWWLDVTDSGVGMSRATLIGPLLDFGRSYWGSELMRQELPGLAASRFQATGRFGIGFYAVFMLGETVRVTTRRFDAASSDTVVLEFREGLSARPILRPASQAERKNFGGTSVAVKLKDDPYSPTGLLFSPEGEPLTLKQVCEHQAPALDCNLAVVEGGSATQFNCVVASDWTSIPAEQLLGRTARIGDLFFSRAYVTIEEISSRVRAITHDGRVVARMSLVPSPPVVRYSDGRTARMAGVVVTGGLQTGVVGGVAGVVLGEPVKADRLKASVSIPADLMAQWASEQAVLWEEILNTHTSEWDISVSTLIRMGGDVAGLHLCFGVDGFMNGAEFCDWAARRTSIIAMDNLGLDLDGQTSTLIDVATQQRVMLDEDIVLIFLSGSYYDNADQWKFKRLDPVSKDPDFEELDPKIQRWWQVNFAEGNGLFVNLIAEAWEMPVVEVLKRLQIENGKGPYRIGQLPNGTEYGGRYMKWRISRNF